MKNFLCTVVAASVMFVFAATAQANCIVPDHPKTPTAHLLPPPQLTGETRTAGADAPEAQTIVGFWSTTFYVGTTADVWDEAFELWHSDGTELALDNAVPPSLGNVCFGTWTQKGRTIRLLHYAWNWNPDGTKAGIFKLEATITVGRSGRTFSGTYLSDSYDLDGHVMPLLHGEGVLRGNRISID